MSDMKTFETSDELEQAGSVEVAAERPQKTFAELDHRWRTVTRHWNNDGAASAQKD